MLWLSSLNEEKAKVHSFSRACRSSEERDKAAEKAPLSSKPAKANSIFGKSGSGHINLVSKLA